MWLVILWLRSAIVVSDTGCGGVGHLNGSVDVGDVRPGHPINEVTGTKDGDIGSGHTAQRKPNLILRQHGHRLKAQGRGWSEAGDGHGVEAFGFVLARAAGLA